MKTTKYIISAFAGLSLLFVSCDEIDNPNKAGQIIPADTSLLAKHILLEKFTGFRCPPCPTAGAEAERLIEKYNGKVIEISYHAGGMSAPEGAGSEFTYDFRTSTGNLYFNNFLTPDYQVTPIGMINRTLSEGVLGWLYTSWSAQIASLADLKADMSMIVAVNYNSGSGQITGTVNIDYDKTGTSDQRLVVAIVEDSVIKPQQVGDQVVLDYAHRNVFRANANGDWGELISSAAIAAGSKFTKNFSIQKGADWNPAHLKAVAYIYTKNENSTNEILQCAQKQLSSK